MSDFLWVEKYRPRKISDCILTEDLKNTFLSFLNKKKYQIFSFNIENGNKTTFARAL